MKSWSYSLLLLAGAVACPCLLHAEALQLGSPQESELPEDVALNAKFNPATVEQVTGVIQQVFQSQDSSGKSGSMRLHLQEKEGQQLTVQLGPEWILTGEGVSLKPGDSVELIGSLVTIDGESWLIASEMKYGNSTVKFRSMVGFPTWKDANWKKEVPTASGGKEEIKKESINDLWQY